jgi:hypothetical protein
VRHARLLPREVCCTLRKVKDNCGTQAYPDCLLRAREKATRGRAAQAKRETDTMTATPRRGGAAGTAGCGGGGRRGAKLGFWIGLIIGFLSVLAPLWATSDHDAAASSSFSTTTATTIHLGGGSGSAANGKRISPNSLTNGPNSGREPILKATLRRESLQDAPSCVHTFGQLELVNTVRENILSFGVLLYDIHSLTQSIASTFDIPFDLLPSLLLFSAAPDRLDRHPLDPDRRRNDGARIPAAIQYAICDANERYVRVLGRFPRQR